MRGAVLSRKTAEDPEQLYPRGRDCLPSLDSSDCSKYPCLLQRSAAMAKGLWGIRPTVGGDRGPDHSRAAILVRREWRPAAATSVVARSLAAHAGWRTAIRRWWNLNSCSAPAHTHRCCFSPTFGGSSESLAGDGRLSAGEKVDTR
jgi:hypothetical protein